MEDQDVFYDEKPEDKSFLMFMLPCELKQRIRALWVSSIIVKVFGQSVGYHYLHQKLHSLWNPMGGMECIDLGHDFFVIIFEIPMDFQFVMRHRPWFVGNHFLAIQRWEPNFCASTASLSSVAIWVRLSSLTIEYYNQDALLRLGRLIGPFLRVDAHTYMGSQGRFALLCVHGNLDQPLKTSISMPRLIQPISL